MNSDIIQSAILVLGGIAVILVNLPLSKARLAGAAIGLLSQPFWVYETHKAGQWGMFWLSCVYILAWAIGVATGIKNMHKD